MRLWVHCVSGTSEMKVEHLRMWHHAETREKDPDPGNWEKVVALIQAASRWGRTRGSMRMADSGDESQGGRHWLPRYCIFGGSVEGDNRYNQLPFIVLYFIPRCFVWFSCGGRNRDRHPRDKYATMDQCHVEDGLVLHLPRPAQIIWWPRQLYISRYPGGIWRGAQDDLHPAEVLGPYLDGEKFWGSLQAHLPEPLQVNSGGTPVTHNFNMVVDTFVRHWVAVVGDPQ